jgi:N-methylhydantoinase B
MSIDPVTFNIFANSVQAIAQEMSADLLRTAYSTVIREAADCSTCLIDSRGRILAQAQNIPLHLNSVSPAIQGALQSVGIQGLTEDEVNILNDAYSGGQHLSSPQSSMKANS